MQNIHVSSRTQTCTQQVVVQQDSTSLLCERKQLMEKETIYSDAEMVGLPQSGGGRRQRMAAGGDTDLSQEDRRKTAASSAVLRPDELLTALENNRPDASASSQGTSRKTAGNRLQNDRKAAVGCSREGNTVATDRLCGGKVAADRLRGGKRIFAVRRGREMAEGSEPDGSEEDCMNGGAAEETAAIGEIDWDDEGLWLSALAEAGISWSGTMEEFCETEIEGARIEWEKGIDGLHSRMREMMSNSEVKDPVIRAASAFRDAFEEMSWRGKESRFAAFISEAMEGIGGVRECSSGEELAQVDEEIVELEEKLLALRVARQELAAEVAEEADQQFEEMCVTVSGLAANVTSQMLEGTFKQIGVVAEAQVQFDEESGRSLGWGVVEFGEAADAVDAAERFNGVELASVQMVVEIGDRRDCGEGEPEGGLDRCEQ